MWFSQLNAFLHIKTKTSRQSQNKIKQTLKPPLAWPFLDFSLVANGSCWCRQRHVTRPFSRAVSQCFLGSAPRTVCHSYSTWDFPKVRLILYIAILNLLRSGRCSYLQYSSMTLCMWSWLLFVLDKMLRSIDDNRLGTF